LTALEYKLEFIENRREVFIEIDTMMPNLSQAPSAQVMHDDLCDAQFVFRRRKRTL